MQQGKNTQFFSSSSFEPAIPQSSLMKVRSAAVLSLAVALSSKTEAAQLDDIRPLEEILDDYRLTNNNEEAALADSAAATQTCARGDIRPLDDILNDYCGQDIINLYGISTSPTTAPATTGKKGGSTMSMGGKKGGEAPKCNCTSLIFKNLVDTNDVCIGTQAATTTKIFVTRFCNKPVLEPCLDRQIGSLTLSTEVVLTDTSGNGQGYLQSSGQLEFLPGELLGNEATAQLPATNSFSVFNDMGTPATFSIAGGFPSPGYTGFYNLIGTDGNGFSYYAGTFCAGEYSDCGVWDDEESDLFNRPACGVLL